ncbi:MAG TPA: NADH-quinone oxidoreductase subunit L [Spirochaetia bacterium]|nr:NADH-quinone oxidoreductase subunit L [Spirochaetia bacterium]
MQQLLWLIPLFPVAGFVVLTLIGRRSPIGLIATIGTGTVGLSAVVALVTGFTFAGMPAGAGQAMTDSLGSWVSVPGLSSMFTLRLDPLSDLMVLVITVVAFFIHLYSTAYIRGHGDYHRYFSYLNLFVGSMLILVLADNFLLLFIGWEGVGLCSYLLIGFWYEDSANGRAAIKAFLVTRIADVAMLIGLFLILVTFGTLDIQTVMAKASTTFKVGAPVIAAIAVLLLIGAIGKSAQIPFQIWLPDAMAGPTPVSALIHAATMVTAGVYLIARTHVLYVLAPGVQMAVAIIGLATLLLGGLSALVQHDIKRILAYSTVSQIGYMFLGLGVGAWSASMFHFLTHAFFKALLFLAAGVLIHSLNNEQDIFRMGGMRKAEPAIFWVFLIGAAALTGIPLVTSGFYSKEAILQAAWDFPHVGHLLWIGAAIGVFLTGYYIFRGFFHVFLGEQHTQVSHKPSRIFYPSLFFLAIGAVLIGFLKTPEDLGNISVVSNFLNPVLPPESTVQPAIGTEVVLQTIASLLALAGVGVAYLVYKRSLKTATAARAAVATHGADYELTGIQNFLFHGLGFDWIATNLFVRPFWWFAGVLKRDWVGGIYDAVGWLSVKFNRLLSLTQSGLIRWYLFGIGVGVLAMLGLVVLI